MSKKFQSKKFQKMTMVILLAAIGSVCGCQTAKPGTGLTSHQNLRPANLMAPALASSLLVDLDNSNELSSLISQPSKVVLVDFYADWCGPCKKQGKVLQQFAAGDSRSQATIVKVNIDQHADLAEQFQVKGLPTLLVFRDGAQVARKTGFSDYDAVASLLEE